MDLREQSMGLEEALGHWYYLNKFEMVKRSLKLGEMPSCLDFGCGRGVFAHLIKRHRPSLEVTAFDPNGLDKEEEGVRFVSVVGRERYDGILLMDVLEHCPDPGLVLREAKERLKNSGLMLVTVPAFQALWSFHDVFLGHYRRYNLPDLEGLCRENGFTVVSGFYLFSYLLPPAWIRRKLLPEPSEGSDLKPAPFWVAWALRFLGKLEAPFASWNRWGGLTVCAILSPLPETR